MMVGRPMQVLGDAFLARCRDDNAELYERLDFTLEDFAPGADWIAEATAHNRVLAQRRGEAAAPAPPAKPKAPPSAAALAAWRKELDGWVAGKMKQWDEDPAFRAKRQQQHASREAYRQAMQAKANAQYAAKVGGTKTPTHQ